MKNIPYDTIEFDCLSFDIKQAYEKFNSIIDSDVFEYIEDLANELYHEKISQE